MILLQHFAFKNYGVFLLSGFAHFHPTGTIYSQVLHVDYSMLNSDSLTIQLPLLIAFEFGSV